MARTRSEQTWRHPRKASIFGLYLFCVFLSTLELCSVPTALPTITAALHASQLTWVGTAHGLSAAAFHPFSGGLAQTYGRRPALLLTIGPFALGSGICGAANSMNSSSQAEPYNVFSHLRTSSCPILSPCKIVAFMLVYTGSLAVLLLPSVLSLEAALPHEDNGTGFSTSIFPSRSLRSYFAIASTVACTIGLTWGGITAP
ncbi:hypothetical protein OG21DRAFT_1190257 [Imleria badia]|nr:hypothetical protein OG21DRAFT_1190257 [Imleria badia]